jgi:hypothetical protein
MRIYGNIYSKNLGMEWDGSKPVVQGVDPYPNEGSTIILPSIQQKTHPKKT